MTPDDEIRSWIFYSPTVDIEYEKKEVKLVINTYLESGRGFMCANFHCKIPQCTLCIAEVGSTDGLSAPHLVQQQPSTVGDSEIHALRKLTLVNDSMTLLEYLQEGAVVNGVETSDHVIEVLQFLKKRWQARKKNVMEVRRRPFKCPGCSDLFDDRVKLLHHHWKTHGVKFPCNMCRFNATSREMIKTHLKDVHKWKTSKH